MQIDKFGRLRISGERPLRADSNRWRRFSKDFQVPEGCDAGAIRARIEKGGVLLITMPKLSSPAPKPAAAGANGGGVAHAQDQQKDHTTSAQQEAPPAAAAAAEPEEEKKEDHKDEARSDTSTERSDQDEHHVASNGAGGRSSPAGQTTHKFAKSRKGMVWAIVAMVLALVGAGLYARYRMMDPSAETASAGTQIVPLSDI